jgi:CBS domain-containing protein
MHVGEVCSREVYMVQPAEPLIEAAREMSRRHVGAVVVVEQRDAVVRPVGIVTDRDVVRAGLKRNAGLADLSVAEAMTRAPLTFDESCTVADAIEQMSARHVRRAPVTGAGGDLVGIVSFDDLLPAVAEELSSLARLIGAQARREGPVQKSA